MTILIVAEHDGTALNPATLHAVTAARAIGGDIDLLVAGTACRVAAEAAGRVAGIRRVFLIEAPHLGHGLAENLASAVADAGRGASHILATATNFGKNLMPRVAALLDVQQVSEIVAVHGPDTFDRPIYAGNAIATVRSPDPVKVLTVRATAFDAAPADGGTATIEPVAPAADAGLSHFVGEALSASERPELTAARVVISGGRALGSAENFHILEGIADHLGAAIGASRAAVDAGYVSNDHQVGQTGKVVAPDLYIAVGISGAIQHLAGMKDSKVIVAINKDEEAPIFQVADYGLVADLFTAVPELERALKQGA
jgi:electron transfer flavoprotein alpha subunit